MKKKIELIADKEYKRVDIFLSENITEYSRSEIKKYIKNGFMKINGETIDKSSKPINEGDKIELFIPDRKESEILPQNIELEIIYEDDNIMVINKKSGMVVHPGAGNYEGTLVNALLSIRPEIAKVGGEKRPGIVHRLDKDTSGLIIIAKDNRTYLELQKQFAQRKVQKKYILIVKGVFKEKKGMIDFPIGRSIKNRKKISSNTNRGREAITYYKVLYEKNGYSLIEAAPKTGRTHQIRVHFSEIGKPIIGDSIYGASAKRGFHRLALHSREIKFYHPIKKQIYCFTTNIPSEFLLFFKKLN